MTTDWLVFLEIKIKSPRCTLKIMIQLLYISNNRDTIKQIMHQGLVIVRKVVLTRINIVSHDMN